uniref:Uncharacterized protein n=1 Tax=Rhizophora mucronata TaxID=61149 RepID=A0A2P2QT82_RHIMU
MLIVLITKAFMSIIHVCSAFWFLNLLSGHICKTQLIM